ncbi:MAG: ComF family protein [Candidatus Omnitrophica bacterium]|nr:ComF family protein [Candidatus Omnitrophota bacterium]
MPRCGPPVCAACGLELPGAFDAILRCARCRRFPPAFQAAAAPWRYEGTAQEALRQFKYRQRHRLGEWLADGMAAAAGARFPLDEIDLIVPVPPHWLANRLRGFDAPHHLARRLARQLGKPHARRALRRTRWTATQTRLSWTKRRRNVHGAFAAKPQMVRNRTVLLVDDVLTSGATADACARALRAAGASRVFVVTAARTPFVRRAIRNPQSAIRNACSR